MSQINNNSEKENDSSSKGTTSITDDSKFLNFESFSQFYDVR